MDRRHFHWKHRTPGEELVDVRWVCVTPLSQCHWSLSHENHVLSYYLLPYKYFLVTGCVCVQVVQGLFFKIDRSYQNCHMPEACNYHGDVVQDIQTISFAIFC